MTPYMLCPVAAAPLERGPYRTAASVSVRERWEDLRTALLRAPSCPGRFWRALSPDELRTLLETLGIFMENHFFAKLVTEIAVAGRERFRRTDPYPFHVGDGMIGVREFIRYFNETNVLTGVSTFVWSAPPAWEAGSGRYFDGHSHGDFGSTAVKDVLATIRGISVAKAQVRLDQVRLDGALDQLVQPN